MIEIFFQIVDFIMHPDCVLLTISLSHIHRLTPAYQDS